MVIRRLTHPLLISLFLFAATTALSAEPVFSIGDEADTQVMWRGEHLITADQLTYFEGRTFADKAQHTKVETMPAWSRVVNTWSADPALPFRKEVAVSADGNDVELNIRADMPSYSQKTDIAAFGYSFRIPMHRVKGMKCSAIIGRTSRPETVTATVDGTANSLLPSPTRYLVLEGNGRSLVLDFNPEGVGTYSDFGPGNIIGCWTVQQSPEYLQCGIGFTSTDHGGVLSGKVRLFEGTMDDYLRRHAYRDYSYFSELPAEKQFCFGAKQHGKEFTDAGLAPYSAATGFGWTDPKDMRIVSEHDSGAVYSAATGTGAKTFRCDLPRPGLYVFTLRCAAYATPQGPFSIAANGKPIVDQLAITPHTLKDISWSQWIENGRCDLAFTGRDFTVSVMAAQMLQHSDEDFKFRRGFWVADGYEPHPLNTNAAFAVPPTYEIAVASIALPEQPIVDPVETPAVPAPETCLPDQSAPEMAWRYNATIGSLGPSNTGSFTEFETPELIERRLKQIQDGNINCVLLNGLLSRLTFPDQQPRVQDTVTLIAATGHRLGMKILDHQDLSLLWNMGSGFRVMTERLGMMQRTIAGGLPTRGFCLTNKAFSDWYFQWITDYIRHTDLDGIMVDEVCYHGPTFCGCADCRRKFTADTGLTLPLDETSPLLNNKSSKLWKTWLLWRMKAVADWPVELRRRVMPFKPYFTIMKYTTHSGYSSNYASLSLGGTLYNAAQSCDFLGTEIMSRNVMASYRAVFAFRKAKNALRVAFGSPIFGLVYPLQSADLAYFGWAMNNMNGQVTWMMSGRRDNSNPFTLFTRNMDLRIARPVSEIAVLFPTQSINWAQHMSVAPDVIGASQAMTDRHILHDFLLEHSLTPEALDRYRVVMLHCACCLSDAQLAVLLDYARQGGTLYMTATTGLLDEMGNARKDWPLAAPLGVTLYGNKFGVLSKPLIRYPGQETVQYTASVVRVEPDKANPPDVLAEVVDANGKVLQPLAVERKYGAGRLIYCAAALSAANFEPEISSGSKWTYAMDKAVDAFNATMIGRAIGDGALQFTPVRFPERLLASVYRQDAHGATTTLVHLLNAGGSPVALGAVVPGEPPLNPAWPAPKEDIVFDIALPSIKAAYVVSPDYPDRIAASFEPLPGGRYRVTMPKDALKCYSIVYLEH